MESGGLPSLSHPSIAICNSIAATAGFIWLGPSSLGPAAIKLMSPPLHKLAPPLIQRPIRRPARECQDERTTPIDHAPSFRHPLACGRRRDLLQSREQKLTGTREKDLCLEFPRFPARGSSELIQRGFFIFHSLTFQ